MISLNSEKLHLIDLAFATEPKPKSFADLGGVWNVDGGYTFYALAKYKPDRAFLVDTLSTERYNELRQHVKELITYTDDFRKPSIAKLIGQVDVIFLFDILLHQVSPDWFDLLKLYANRTNIFLIYNPQWTKNKETTRLLDLGQEEYFKNVPHTPDHSSYQNLIAKRDSTGIWQWGITDDDLIAAMKELGFSLNYFKNCGRFGQLENFENHAFIFCKAEPK